MDSKNIEESRPSKTELIQALEELTQEPGFLYSLAIVLRHDLFLDPEQSADINWRERLSFQEASFLIGLTVKHEIDISVLPSKEVSETQINRIYDFFQKLHQAHSLPLAERILVMECDKTMTPEEAEKSYRDLFGGGEVMTEPIFYGGSGAYDFQYWEFATKKYEKDEAWIKTKKGISLNEMCLISANLKKYQEKRLCGFKGVKTFDDFCTTCLSIFCFSLEDLTLDREVLEKFIKAFSVKPGTVNQNLDSQGGYNAVDSHPIVILKDGLYFLPISFCLAQSIYESPYYWMSEDSQYKDTAFKHRGETTEEITYEILRAVFGKNNVYKSVTVSRNKKELISDIDILAIVGNKAVIVQAKSKKLTELSRKGDNEKLKEDFKQAVQKAYEQGKVCRAAILDKINTLTTEDGLELRLGEFIDDAYIICLTSDHYPAVTYQVGVYLQKQPEDPYPLAMSIFDLDIIAFYLKDPFEFLYYLRQRVRLTNYFHASSEMSLLGCHLRRKLFPLGNVDGEMLDESFAQLIDANFPVMRGDYPKTSAVDKLHSKWKNEKFKQLLEQVKSSKEAGFTDAILYLYDLAGEGADDLIKWIEKVKEYTRSDGQQHDFSMIFENGKSGISFLSSPDSPEKLEQELIPLATSRKYKTKADVWLALGSIVGSSNFVDAIAFNKRTWTEDKELERLSKILLKQGISIKPSGKKQGRNERCLCGSGKKYKYCCGR